MRFCVPASLSLRPRRNKDCRILGCGVGVFGYIRHVAFRHLCFLRDRCFIWACSIPCSTADSSKNAWSGRGGRAFRRREALRPWRRTAPAGPSGRISRRSFGAKTPFPRLRGCLHGRAGSSASSSPSTNGRTACFGSLPRPSVPSRNPMSIIAALRRWVPASSTYSGACARLTGGGRTGWWSRTSATIRTACPPKRFRGSWIL